MDKTMPRVAVVTTTYNMGHMLYRAYQSIQKQTYSNFYWLIVDNGSTDNTQKVVEQMMAEQKLEIIYHKKEYGNRSTAIDYTLDVVDAEYFCLSDADDELTENALNIFMGAWNQISVHEKDQYFRVSALCIDATTGEIIGGLFPVNANTPAMQKKLGYLGTFERHDMMRTAAFEGKRFPRFEEEILYLGEGILWQEVLKSGKRNYFVNEVTRIYHQDHETQESRKISVKKIWGSCIATAYSLNNTFYPDRFPILNWLRLLVYLTYNGLLCRKSIGQIVEMVEHLPEKIVVTLLTPSLYIYARLKWKGVPEV